MHVIPNRLAALATVLAAAAALAGLALTGLYVDAPNWAQQARGTDLATLFLAVPVLAIGLWRATRGSSAGRLAVTAGLLYLVYNYAIFSFAVAMNSLTAVHIAIFGLSLWSLVLAGRAAVDGPDGVTERLNRRAAGGLLIGVAAMFGLLWLRADRDDDHDERPAAGPPQGRYLEQPRLRPGPRVLPATLRSRRDRSAAQDGAAAYAFSMLIWVALMGAGVVGGFLLMALASDQIAVPVVVAIGGLSVASAILAAVAVVRQGSATGLARTTPSPAYLGG